MTTSIPELTLYSAKVCPWAQRATLAVEEVGAKVNHIEIDLANKPSWCLLRAPRSCLLVSRPGSVPRRKPSDQSTPTDAEKVNPASKVPVLALGNEANIPESHVILELIADLYKDTEKSILPETPLLRAEARYFIERFNQVVWTPAVGILFQGKAENGPSVLAGITEIQGLLKKHAGPFALGSKVTIADLGVLPFIGRILTLGKAGLLKGGVYEEIVKDSKYKSFVDYADALMARPSFAATFDEAYILEKMKARIAASA
ncbi:glutathione S-transferase, partial [Phenoliferia sp. Uapishka_3]